MEIKLTHRIILEGSEETLAAFLKEEMESLVALVRNYKGALLGGESEIKDATS